MCGITGFMVPIFDTSSNLRDVLTRMTNRLSHRGPDDSGVWLDEAAGIGLGHRRLSILDLSPEGRQPMASHCGRFIITYNGEVYNFIEIRRELESKGHHFRGRSDTEVVLEAIAQWGVHSAVRRFVGMFAFAVWDCRERILYLVRDRLGIKPLYYGWLGKSFLFGSELKAIKVHPSFRAEINRDVLALYLRYNYVPAPYSIYTGIGKLMPGCVLTLRADGGPGDLKVEPYWSARQVSENGVKSLFDCPEQEIVDALDLLLREAVRLRLVADVPLGAFLSGGVDSSAVVALMQAQSSRPVKTFTIGFHEFDYNEAGYAREVARHLGTEHTELYLTSKEVMAVLPRLPELYDEPFSDSSQIPTFLVSELARRQVKVILSGDGGDELFGGYNRYLWGRRIWGKIGWIPPGLRRFCAKLLLDQSPLLWNRVFEFLKPALPQKLVFALPGEKIHKFADVLPAESPEVMYHNLISFWKRPEELIDGANEPETVFTAPLTWPDLPDPISRMMFFDLVSYLPDDILTKVDRASMGVALETRAPLLDHRVVEFSWKLPLEAKIRNGQGKWLLRQVLSRYVPDELIERPKMGFSIPIDRWLRGPLRDWAESLLSSGRLKSEGYFRPGPIRKLWLEHLRGEKNAQNYLWAILMFQGWLEEASDPDNYKNMETGVG